MNQSFYPGEDLASHFPLKAALSIFFLALVHHAFMFLCFSLLVLADLLSRWIAISAALLRAEGEIGGHPAFHDSRHSPGPPPGSHLQQRHERTGPVQTHPL